MSGTIKGIYGKPVKAPVKLTVGNFVFYTKRDGYYYIWLSPGIYTIDVHKESYYPYTFSTKVCCYFNFSTYLDSFEVWNDFSQIFLKFTSS